MRDAGSEFSEGVRALPPQIDKPGGRKVILARDEAVGYRGYQFGDSDAASTWLE